MPRAKCPQCATVVEYDADYDVICPHCGFQGASPVPHAARAAGATVPTLAPQVQYVQVAAAPSNGAATAALVVGLVAFAFPPLALAAIVLGAVGLGVADRYPLAQRNTGQAIAGLVLGLVMVALFLLLMLSSDGDGWFFWYWWFFLW